jgi:Immunity protein 53
MNKSLKNLIDWYTIQCDGLWEHTNGITIHSLDNPGFSINIDLLGTRFENNCYQSIDWESNTDLGNEWISCYKTDEKIWVGACSPKQLERTIDLFIQWTLLSEQIHYIDLEKNNRID